MLSVRDEWKVRTNVRITVRDLDGRIVDVEEFHNLIVTAGRNLLRGAFRGDDVKIKYIALGAGNTAPALTDEDLASEQFRKAITQWTTPATGQLKTTAYIAPGEALSSSFTIAEIGWFAGASATAALGSGTMVSRVLYSRAKTNLESIQIDRTDTFNTP